MHWSCYCTLNVYVVIHFCDIWFYEWKVICAMLFLIAFIYKRCRWRSNYQEGEGCDVIDGWSPSHFIWLSWARISISNDICSGFFYIQWIEVSGDWSFFGYCWIVDHHCLNIILILITYSSLIVKTWRTLARTRTR